MSAQVQPGPWMAADAAVYVTEAYAKSVLAVIETGRRLIEAKANLPHGQWLPFVDLLPFSERTARYLMAIADHPDLTNRQHVADLPSSWGTLAVLAQLPPGEVTTRIESGEITPELERSQAEEWARGPKPMDDPPSENLADLADAFNLALCVMGCALRGPANRIGMDPVYLRGVDVLPLAAGLTDIMSASGFEQEVRAAAWHAKLLRAFADVCADLGLPA